MSPVPGMISNPRSKCTSIPFSCSYTRRLPSSFALPALICPSKVTAPIITANWEADSGDRWIVPVGGGVGKIFAIGSQKINGQAQAFYNVVKIDSLDGPDWSLRLQLQFLFPKGR